MGVGCRVWGVGCGVQGAGCRVWGVYPRGQQHAETLLMPHLGCVVQCGVSALVPVGFGVWGLRFRVQGLGFRVQDSGSRVPLGFRVWDLWFRV